MTTQPYSVQTIREYLLGQLPESETERLDELSITDESCAELIRAVEHDLVDGFARGELDEAVMEQFRSRYLTTPAGREAARFAAALQSLDENSRRGGSSEAVRVPTMLVREKGRWRERLALAAAVVMLATSGVWLAFENRTLRARVSDAEAARAELQRDRQLREADARRPPDTAPLATGPGPSPLTVATMVLTPQLRGVGQLPTVALASSSGELSVQLDLEPVDYPTYEAALVASSGERVLWRSDRLIARTAGDRKRIDLRLPATLLSPQDYLIRVSGVPARGVSEIVGEYRFTVVR
jgi:type II secretory pathway component PulM